LALAHAVYRQREAITAAIGFQEAGMIDGLALAWVVMAHRRALALRSVLHLPSADY
jgi:hypothetical protein